MKIESQSNNKRIAKNTFFLYIRMMFLMILSLYTSRIVLSTLGVEDYGLYNVVGGIVTFLGFLNAALSNGTSRFITFEMGKKNGEVKKTFQNAFIVHCLLAAIILVLAESVGLWFLYYKLGIPHERMTAAFWVFQFSIITTILNITQVPYSSLIISHEKMDIYAYATVAEGILKLLVVYALTISENWDKLIVYGLLLCIVQSCVLFFYRFYCVYNYKESSLSNLKFEKRLSNELLSFSGWSLLGNLAHSLNAQGMNIITNMFFGPTVVAARALSTTVNSAVMSLSNNFRVAANPQIIKLYSSGCIPESKKLMLSTTQYSYYMMLVFAIPLIFSCNEVLSLWLKEVPEWTVIFVQLIMVQSLLFTFDTCFYTGLYACGRVKENALVSPLLYFIQFVGVYFLFKKGFSPLTLSYAGIFTSAIAAFAVKPFLLNRYASYSYKEVYKSIVRCFIVTVVCLVVPYLCFRYFKGSVFVEFLKILINGLYTLVIVFSLGLTRDQKQSVLKILRNKIIQS